MKDRFSKNQYLFVWLVVVALFAIGLFSVWYFFGKGNKDNVDDITPLGFTSDELEKASTLSPVVLTRHDIQTDCWIGYSGKAYEVTEVLDTQKEIVSSDCGTVVSTELSQGLIDELARYEVGKLSN